MCRGRCSACSPTRSGTAPPSSPVRRASTSSSTRNRGAARCRVLTPTTGATSPNRAVWTGKSTHATSSFGPTPSASFRRISAARYRFHAHRQEGPRKLFNSSGVRFHVSAAKPPPSRRVDVAWMSCLGHARPHGSLVHLRAIGETAAGPPPRIAVQEDERPHWSPTPRYSAQPGSRHDWGKNREGPHQHADPCAR
jgi:hypothetical protein